MESINLAFVNAYMNIRIPQKLGICWVIQQPLAYQQGLWYVQFVMSLFHHGSSPTAVRTVVQ